MTEAATVVSEPFKWVIVNDDGYEYLIGKSVYGDEFVKTEDGRVVRRALEPKPMAKLGLKYWPDEGYP